MVVLDTSLKEEVRAKQAILPEIGAIFLWKEENFGVVLGITVLFIMDLKRRVVLRVKDDNLTGILVEQVGIWIGIEVVLGISVGIVKKVLNFFILVAIQIEVILDSIIFWMKDKELKIVVQEVIGAIRIGVRETVYVEVIVSVIVDPIIAFNIYYSSARPVKIIKKSNRKGREYNVKLMSVSKR